ncbi:MAG: MFS transporter [Actinomycetota bacterium]
MSDQSNGTEPAKDGVEPTTYTLGDGAPAARPSKQKKQKRASSGALARGKLGFKQYLREAANYKVLRKTPYGLKPIMIFVIISVAQAFDGNIFGRALPEIIKDLDIKATTLFQSFQVVGFLLIFGTLGIAYYADRRKRVPLVAGGLILGGFASLFTSTVRDVGPLAMSRMGDSLGGTVAGIPASSLLADYYPPNSRGKVYALSGVLGQVVGIITPFFVAYLVLNYGWRLPFRISGPLMMGAGIFAYFALKEPVRGYMERRELGATEEEAMTPEDPVSFGEAWRTIWAIRTLRRFFLASIPGGIGGTIYGFYFSLLLVEKYGLDIGERVLLFSVVGIILLPFGLLSGGLVDVLLRYRPKRVLVFDGLLGVASALFLFVVSSAPPLWFLMVVLTLFSIASTLLGPAGNVLIVNILPAHIRTLGSSVFALAGIPAAVFNFLVVGAIATKYGTQGALFFACPIIVVAALLRLSAAGLFERDVKAAGASQLASSEWRKAKESGTGKLLVCRDIDVEYDGVQVLFNVDFDVEEGQIIALLGTNGAGKSTLLRAISGTQEASAGAIVFDGRDITHMPPHEIANRQVIHMPGGRGVFPGLTVGDNLVLGTWTNDEPDGGKARLEEVYSLFPILKERQSEKAGLLSGGEQQMVSLGQAFLSRPRLLMIDELSLGLSPAVVGQLIEVVRQIHAQGTTIIIVEQSVNVALTVAERAIFMEKGEVKFIGETKELLQRPDILRAIYVKGTGSLTEGAPAGTLRSERERRQHSLTDARPILEIKGISKSFGGIKAVNDVSFALREGEALGLIGPNGAGKTTIFDLISGFQVPDSGQIIFDGKDISNLRPDERAKLRMVRRFQDARMFPALSVYENLLVSLEAKLDVRSMALTALQVPQVRQGERRIRLRADRLLELLDLGAYRDKFVRELSTGLRRIADLACVLAAEPKVLLLDEPSTGIAQAESEGLGPLLRRVRFETGCSMLVIEHDMPLISVISDELIALQNGAFLMRGTPEDVLNDERVIASYLGTSDDVIKRSGALT